MVQGRAAEMAEVAQVLVRRVQSARVHQAWTDPERWIGLGRARWTWPALVPRIGASFGSCPALDPAHSELSPAIDFEFCELDRLRGQSARLSSIDQGLFSGQRGRATGCGYLQGAGRSRNCPVSGPELALRFSQLLPAASAP